MADDRHPRGRGVNGASAASIAVDDCSFAMAPHKVWGLIGPNGSGKTTLFNLISGVLAPDSGQIVLQGRNVAGWPATASLLTASDAPSRSRACSAP